MTSSWRPALIPGRQPPRKVGELAAAQSAGLDRDGYLILRHAVPEAWHDDLRHAFEAGAEVEDQWGAPRGEGWRHSLVDLDPVVRSACRLPSLLAAAGRILSCPFFLSQVEGREPCRAAAIRRCIATARDGPSLAP